MERYNSQIKLKENKNKAEHILNHSKISNAELYQILYETGHTTISMWKNDRSNLVVYLIDMLNR